MRSSLGHVEFEVPGGNPSGSVGIRESRICGEYWARKILGGKGWHIDGI